MNRFRTCDVCGKPIPIIQHQWSTDRPMESAIFIGNASASPKANEPKRIDGSKLAHLASPSDPDYVRLR